MKKKYLTPKAKVVNLETSELICMSFDENGETSGMYSKKSSFYFFEEDEEDTSWDE